MTLLSSAAIASSVTVPDDFPSIQAGIDSNADTVLVRDGDYPETPEAYRSLTLRGIGDSRPRVRGALITNPISGSLHRAFSDIEFTAPVTMNTYNFHARILDIVFEHCTLDSGLVHSYYEDPEDIEYLTLDSCMIHGDCYAWSYVVYMQADTLDGGVAWNGVNTIHVTNSWFRGGTGIALEIRGSVIDLAITGNLLEGYATGIYSPDGANLAAITSNVIRHMTGDRFAVSRIAAAGDGIMIWDDEYTVAYNVIEDCGCGIECWGGEQSIVENVITRAKSDGILSFNARGFRAERNLIWRCGGDGINDVNTYYGHVAVLENTIVDVARSAIELGAYTDHNVARIQGNIAYGNLGWGLRIQVPQDSLYLGCNDWFRNGMGAVTGVAESADDFKFDPLFCSVSAGDVSLYANSPLVGRPSCGQIGAKGVGCAAVATTLTRLIVSPEGQGLAVHWGFGKEDPAVSWIERATEEAGPWDSLGTGTRLPDNEFVLLDKEVDPGKVYLYRVAWPEGSTVTHSTPVSASLDAAPSSRVTPNPSRGAVDIEWALASAAEAEIRVYDLAGRQVAEVASGRFEAGSHRAHWDGRGSSGAVAPSGWYVIRVIRGSAKTDHRLLLLR